MFKNCIISIFYYYNVTHSKFIILTFRPSIFHYFQSRANDSLSHFEVCQSVSKVVFSVPAYRALKAWHMGFKASWIIILNPFKHSKHRLILLLFRIFALTDSRYDDACYISWNLYETKAKTSTRRHRSQIWGLTLQFKEQTDRTMMHLEF